VLQNIDDSVVKNKQKAAEVSQRVPIFCRGVSGWASDKPKLQLGAEQSWKIKGGEGVRVSRLYRGAARSHLWPFGLRASAETRTAEMVKAAVMPGKQALLQSRRVLRACCPRRFLRSKAVQAARTRAVWFLKNRISMSFRHPSCLAVNNWAPVSGHVQDPGPSPFQEGGGGCVPQPVHCELSSASGAGSCSAMGSCCRGDPARCRGGEFPSPGSRLATVCAATVAWQGWIQSETSNPTGAGGAA